MILSPCRLVYAERDAAPSEIKDLRWVPTKIIRDKVYDGIVSFTAEDQDSIISEAYLDFLPLYPAHLPREAFPEEPPRRIKLEPIDGLFEQKMENFIAEITNIKGGKEYEIKAVVKDAAGNVAEALLKTPYIREFENVGKSLYEKGIVISASYMPWEFAYTPMPPNGDIPVLGRTYDTFNDIVQWKHVDWAQGHGVNVFYIDGGLWEPFKVKERWILKGLMDKGMKAAILWGGHWKNVFKMGGKGLPEWAVDLSDPYNFGRFLDLMINLLSSDIFLHPNYHKVSGKLTIFMWDENALVNRNEAYAEWRKLSKEITGQDLFIIADCLPRILKTNIEEYLSFWDKLKGDNWWQHVDALTSWIGFYEPSLEVELSSEERVENYLQYYEQSLKTWKNFSEEKGKCFVPTITPGFDNSYSWGGPQIQLPRSIDRFTKALNLAVKYSEGYKEIRVDTWNDWGEWTYVEPSKLERFSYLETLKGSIHALKVYRALLSITTESDWTRIYIDGVVEVLIAKLNIESGADAPNLVYFLDTNTIPPGILIGKRQFDTTKVVLQAQLILNITDHFGDIVLTVQKGNLQYTRVEVYNSNGAEDVLVGSFTNSIVDGTGANTMNFTLPTLALAKGGPLTPPSYPGLQKIVWAFYYPWYWKEEWDTDPKFIDEPLIGSYSSSDRNVIEKHIRMAKSSGIDGFISSWWGPGSYTDKNLRSILDVAKKHDFEVSIYLESLEGEGEARSLDQLTEWLIYFLRTYREAEAIYRIDGKPVIFVWAAQSHTPSEWAQVFSAVEKSGHSAKYIATVPMDPNHLMYDPSWLDVFDGLHNYGTVGVDKLDVIYRQLSMVIRTYPLLANSSKLTLWAPSISPGYDDRAVPRRRGTYQPREEGRYYQSTFSAALGSEPDWLLITSWNEFPENTHIEPSVNYGYKYVDLTALFTSQFKDMRLSPKVVVMQWVSKGTVYLNETLQVQVSITNRGCGAAVNLTSNEEPFRPFIILKDGLAKRVDRLFVGESLNYTITYKVKEPGRFEVPKTDVTFLDVYGNHLSAISEPVFIDVRARAVIDKVSVSRARANIDSSQTVFIHVSWENNGSAIRNAIIYVNGSGYITNSTGWISISVMSPNVGLKIWKVTGIMINSHEWLWIQSVPDPSVIFDQIQLSYEVDTWSLGAIKFLLNLKYAYDSQPVTDALIKIDNIKAHHIGDGKYSLTLPTWSPTLGVDISVEKAGFKPLKLKVRSYVTSNIILEILIPMLIIATMLLIIRRKKYND